MKNAAFKPTPPVAERPVAANGEPGNAAVYEEYLRGFDEIPVLQDAVRLPPSRSPQPDFRLGERRDVRQQPRPDAYSVREENSGDLVLQYQEYSQAELSAVRPKRKKTPKRKSKSKKR
jgi:hypothetical protein